MISDNNHTREKDSNKLRANILNSWFKLLWTDVVISSKRCPLTTPDQSSLVQSWVDELHAIRYEAGGFVKARLAARAWSVSQMHTKTRTRESYCHAILFTSQHHQFIIPVPPLQPVPFAIKQDNESYVMSSSSYICVDEKWKAYESIHLSPRQRVRTCHVAAGREQWAAFWRI